ncbi:DUF2306 domain-containing protein [Roseiterribacter gracilis]|uniref:Membrane protein n=1 Tax=Roseiterribacter gracilis TaxID=2812848 RepID=A0A8S8X853_9PROT|nr:membrane protein [Rhodospirillales bacterium TMPK1]
MTTTTMTAPRFELADRALRIGAGFWWCSSVLGQWAFFYYIAIFYGPSTLQGDFAVWAKNTHLLKGYVAGDTIGNLIFGVHALLAGIVAFGGALQMLPQIRRHVPAFHRWNGRIFLVTALGVSVTGLYMVWVRGATINLIGSLTISGNAVLIIVCAVAAWRAALRRDFTTHRVWALRTYLVANGQWFFRAGIFAWIMLNQGPVGLGKNFDGPVVIFWSIGCYALPLLVLEFYLRAKEHGRGRYAVASVLVVSGLLAALGIFGTYMALWRPVLALN